MKKFIVFGCFGLVLFCVWWVRVKEVHLRGETMGTTYEIRAYRRFFSGEDKVRKFVSERLLGLNETFSTYDPESEISRFNGTGDSGWIAVSPDFFHVIREGQWIFKESGGAWDGTVEPLVRLWGFYDGDKRMPRRSEIRSAMRNVGFGGILIGDGEIRKQNPFLSLDLSSVAKGYSVDVIAKWLMKNGYDSVYVEIGGEVYAGGAKPSGESWRIGISDPVPGSRDVKRVIALENECLATSGDYRNFFIRDGRRYSHLIDPRTGMPVHEGVVSVSVKAECCLIADAVASAVMVLGREEGPGLIEKLEGVEGFLVFSDGVEWGSLGFFGFFVDLPELS